MGRVTDKNSKENQAQSDVRVILPTLISMLKEHHFSPIWCAKAIYLGVTKGLEYTRDLPWLRKSYLRYLFCLSVVYFAQVVVANLLVWKLAQRIYISVFGTVWFLLASILAFSQLGLVRAPDGTIHKKFGVANALTFYRFVNAPLVITLIPLMPGNQKMTQFVFVLYVVSALSDMLDGTIARLTKQVSEFGRIYDPVTDIILNVGTSAMFTFVGFLPLWFFVLAEIRFLLPAIGGSLFYVYKQPLKIKPTLVGKATVAVYHCLLGSILLRELLQHPILEELVDKLLVLSTLFVVFNIIYLIDMGIQKLKHKPEE